MSTPILAGTRIEDWLDVDAKMPPMMRLEGALLQYRNSVLDLMERQETEDFARRVLAERKQAVYAAGVPGKNGDEREAYMTMALAAENENVLLAERQRRDAGNLLLIAKERLSVEKIRSRAIIALLCQTDED